MAHASLPAAAAAALGRRCSVCGGALVEAGPPRDAEPAPMAPAATTVPPETLPTFLAQPWAALLAEPHPRVRLHWMLDTAEVAVRWAAAVALAEVLHHGDGALPGDVAGRVRDHIERPTLGRWLAILRALSRERPPTPLLAGGVFDLYEATFAPRFRAEGDGDGGTPEGSLLALRNHVAHGGGLSRARAQSLLDAHLPGLEGLLGETRAAVGELEVVALAGGAARRLVGPAATACPVPTPLEGRGDGPWLIGSAGALPLLPLADFGAVRVVAPDGALEERPGPAAPQLYARGDRDRLTYTPLGRDEACSETLAVATFRRLFRLDEAAPRRTGPGEGGPGWDAFLREARTIAEDLVGRRDEIAALKSWLRARRPHEPGRPRLGWLAGAPGVGKSMVMARLAADFGNTPPDRRGLYYHRFRGGDARNSRRAFLRLLRAALCDWPPLAGVTTPSAGDAADGRALEDDVRERLAAVAGLPPPRDEAPPPAFWVFVDGIDEVVGGDPTLPALLRSLALPGTVWLVAGRAEHGLAAAFAGDDCDAPFPDGLPPMRPDDVRAMLLEGLGPARYGVLARDEDAGEAVRNAFVDRVVARAHGLPLYVHLLLEDLRAGRLGVRDEDRLPDGLTAYYDALLARVGLSTVRRDLPLVVCLLARAVEPLDVPALAALLGGSVEDAPEYEPRVANALRAGRSLVRRAPTRDGGEGWTLYHQSFREYVGGRDRDGDRPATPPAPALADVVREAERLLCRAAADWERLPPGTLRRHLFRWGTEYALWWQGEAGVAAARGRLTDFAYLQARTAALPAGEATDLADEYAAVLARLPRGGGRDATSAEEAFGSGEAFGSREAFAIWEAFFRERAHLLRRGDGDWGAHRILLQLAVEHADDSPVTQAAEAWLATGACDWVWLRRTRRPRTARPSPCVRTFEGHTGAIGGAAALPGDRLLSWSGDRTLRLWSFATGECAAVLEGHEGPVGGALALPDGRLVSWSDDATLRLWAPDTGACLAVLRGHTGPVHGARLLPNGRLLSWAGGANTRDKTLRLWSPDDGACIAVLAGHTGYTRKMGPSEDPRVMGALPLDGDRLISWARDETARVWSAETGDCLAIFEAKERIHGVTPLDGDRVVAWGWDTLRVWSTRTGTCHGPIQLKAYRVAGLVLLDDDRTVCWSHYGPLLIVSLAEGALVAVLAGHDERVAGALALDDDRVASWSWDGTVRLWSSADGATLHTLEGHGTFVEGAVQLSGARLLSWSSDGTLRLWSTADGSCLATLDAHQGPLSGLLPLGAWSVVSWAGDDTLRHWNLAAAGAAASLAPHEATVRGALPLPGRRHLTWGDDGTPQLWSGETGGCLATLRGHATSVQGALALPGQRLVTWSGDNTLRVWSGETGACLATLRGHAAQWRVGHQSIIRGALALDADRVLSWSLDGTLRLWSTRDAACLAVFEGHERWVIGALALDDDRIVSWSLDGTIRLWSSDGACLRTFVARAPVYDALLLADGRLLSCSSDGTIHLLSVDDGARLRTLARHSARVRGVRELPDERLLSWSDDGTVCLWSVDPARCLARFVDRTGFIRGACAVGRRGVLSWSDDTLRAWDTRSGAALGAWPLAAAARERPDLWAAYRRAAAPDLCRGALLAESPSPAVDVVRWRGGRARWHGDGDWRPRWLDEAGELLATCARDVAFLRLHHGQRPLTASEAARLLRSPRGAG